jgi:zinc protease
VWLPGPGPGVGLLLAPERPRDPAVQVGVAVLAQRLRDVARHARGLSYAVQTVVLDLAAHRRDVAVLVDARRGQEAEVGRVLWEQFRALCSPGPTAEEVAHVVEALAEELDTDPAGPDAVLGELTDAAGCLLDGVPYRPAADVLADWATVTPEQVRAELAAMSATALLHLPEGAPLGPAPAIEAVPWCGRLPELPAGTVYRAPLRSRLRGGGKAALVVSPAGLAHRDDDGDVHSLPWEWVQAVVPVDDGRGLFVVAGNMCTALVHPSTYGPRAVAAVRAALPPGLRVLEQVTLGDARPAAAAV